MYGEGEGGFPLGGGGGKKGNFCWGGMYMVRKKRDFLWGGGEGGKGEGEGVCKEVVKLKKI